VDSIGIVFFIIIAALVIAGVIAASIAAKKRREAFAVLAQRLELTYSAGKDYSLADRYEFLDKLAQGSDRYAYNILSGVYQHHSILAFDYHYETYSRDSKGNRQTHHHHFSFFILEMERAFPELTISREGVFSKVAQALGYDDIDFESHEFSRKFCVRSKDKKFAYDVCHPRMMEYLLANPDLTIEIEVNVLALAFSSCLDVEQIEPNLKRLVQVRSLMPQYLFAAA
jgi:hypothetical protein